MICPKCGSRMDTRDTRIKPNGTVDRRRVCRSCGNRFHTLEHEVESVIIKSTYKTRLAERLVHRLGYKSDLTGKTYNTKQEALDATMMELNNILTQEDNNE